MSSNTTVIENQIEVEPIEEIEELPLPEAKMETCGDYNL